jgi:hypothetical protein
MATTKLLVTVKIYALWTLTFKLLLSEYLTTHRSKALHCLKYLSVCSVTTANAEYQCVIKEGWNYMEEYYHLGCNVWSVETLFPTEYRGL